MWDMGEGMERWKGREEGRECYDTYTFQVIS